MRSTICYTLIDLIKPEIWNLLRSCRVLRTILWSLRLAPMNAMKQSIQIDSLPDGFLELNWRRGGMSKHCDLL